VKQVLSRPREAMQVSGVGCCAVPAVKLRQGCGCGCECMSESGLVGVGERVQGQ
jgi:hypothetical protein